MPYLDFEPVQDLKPAAFKLYVYFLHRAEQTGMHSWPISLAELGWESHLQAHITWRWPAQRHGKDGSLRGALAELVSKGLVEKTGCRGRRPNIYRLLKLPKTSTNNP